MPRPDSMPGPDLDVEDDILTRAYLLWELEGRQDRDIYYYWYRARDLIEAETRSAHLSVQSLGHQH